ncbi:hypothetical protein GCM10022221_33610 [Actinocorallia aurea]
MHPAVTDSALVRAAGSGDRQALEDLLSAHLPLVYNVVGRALDGHPDVDDVVQETMLRAMTALPGLRDPARFRSWLIAIALRQTQERGRNRGAALARQRPLEEGAELADPGADPFGETLVKVALSEQRREIAAATRWLSPDDQRLLALWWQEVAGTLSRADLAGALDISQAHAAVRVQRMRAQLDLARGLVRAWRATPRCAGLGSTGGGRGSREALSLKRFAKHLRECEVCAATHTAHMPADRLLTAAAVLPVPALLAAKIAALLKAGAVAPALASAAQSGGGSALLLPPKAAAIGGSVVVAAAASFVFAVNVSPARTPLEPGGPDAAVPEVVSVLPPVVGPTEKPSPKNKGTKPESAAGQTGTADDAGGDDGGNPPAPGVTGVSKADLYVAPNGSDTNAGTLDAPLASLKKAAEVVEPGQTIALRGGTYRPAEPVAISTSGTADRRITLSGYRDEEPVIDASLIRGNQWFVTQRASFWTVQNLAVHSAKTYPWVCFSCTGTVFQRLEMYENGATGLMLRGEGTSGNSVLDSDFHDNHDDAKNGENADGVQFKDGSGTGNVIRGVRAYRNSDDGVDLSGFASPVEVRRSWAFGNGHNRWGLPDFAGAGTGFKLGGGDPVPDVAHVVTDNAAWDNASFGFTEQNNKAAIVITRNTAYRNGDDGFAFWYSKAVMRANLALGNGRDDNRGDETVESGNSWDQQGWDTADLASTDPSSAEGPRPPDGSLPATPFLTPTRPDAGAPMID